MQVASLRQKVDCGKVVAYRELDALVCSIPTLVLRPLISLAQRWQRGHFVFMSYLLFDRMRWLKRSLLLFWAWIAFAIAGCSDGASGGTSTARVTVEALAAALQAQTAVATDVRDRASFDRGHIAGAQHLPFDEVEARLSELPRDKQIVTYCS